METRDDKEIDTLWLEYGKSKNIEVRNQIILKYIYLVKFVVNRLWSSYSHRNQADEMMSSGVFGLIDAIDRFDIKRGVKFETYAYLRIRGEIIDQFRKNDWIPKNVRTQAKIIEESMCLLEEKLGRHPSDQEIADKLSISVEDYFKVMAQIHSSTVVSFEEQVANTSAGLFAIMDKGKTPDQMVCDEEVKTILISAIKDIPENEKQVLNLYYFDQLNLKEIGIVLGVSESRVSQIHTKALMRLKNKLTRHKDLFFREENA